MNDLDAGTFLNLRRWPIDLANYLAIHFDSYSLLRERKEFKQRSQVDAIGHLFLLPIYLNAHKIR